MPESAKCVSSNPVAVSNPRVLLRQDLFGPKECPQRRERNRPIQKASEWLARISFINFSITVCVN
jgi:hypothetical protein